MARVSWEKQKMLDVFREIKKEAKKIPGIKNIQFTKSERQYTIYKNKDSKYYGCEYCLDAEENGKKCPHESCIYADYIDEVGGFQNLCFGKNAKEIDNLWKKVLRCFADEKLI